MPISPWRLRFYARKWRAALYDQSVCEQFAKAIREGDGKAFVAMLANPKLKMRIDPNYQDADGNTFLHLAVMQGTWFFVTPVCELGVPNNLANKAGKLPCDLTSCFKRVVGDAKRYRPIQYDSLRQKQVRRDALVKQMQAYYREDLTGGIYPGRRLVDDLNLTFECVEGACVVPDSWEALNDADKRRLTLHQRLAIAQHVSSSRALTIETMAPDTTSNCYVTAALTFVITDDKYIGGGLNTLKAVTIPINVPGYLVYSDDKSYAHAEEELFAYLNQESMATHLVAELQSTFGVTVGYKCYAVIFDLHTTYNMCGSCEGKMYGVEGSHEAGVVNKLEKALVKAGILLPPERTMPDLLRPSSAQLFVSARVSCHSNYPHIPPTSERGHFYPSFEGASNRERNIANHKNAVVFHAAHSSYIDLERYRFSSSKRRSFAPCFVPNQTAFVMKSNSSRQWGRRRQLQRPVKINASVMQAGLAIMPTTSARFSFFAASNSLLLGFVRKGDVSTVGKLIEERLSDIKALSALMLAKDREGDIYHAAAISNDPAMLDLVDCYLAMNFPEARTAMLTSVEDSPLASAQTLEIFYQLVGIGAQDPCGEYGVVLYDALLDSEAKLNLLGFYQERGWLAGFADVEMDVGDLCGSLQFS